MDDVKKVEGLGYSGEVPTHCEGCYYRKKLGAAEGVTACHYALYEEKLRPCPTEECTVKLILSEEEAAKRDRERKKVATNNILLYSGCDRFGVHGDVLNSRGTSAKSVISKCSRAMKV